MRTMSLMAIGALAGIGIFVLCNHGLQLTPMARGQNGAAAPAGNLGDLSALSDRFETVARYVLPAVVAIEAKKTTAGPVLGATSRTTEDSGTGVLVTAVDAPGVIVITNNHVISGARADQININLADGRFLRPTAVLGDPETDVAVMKVDGQNLPTAKFGDSDRTRIGQWVLALGSPFGLNQSVTHGIISARDRGQVVLGNSIRVKDFIQTDAAINPGSSGGPLVNLNGEIVGINTAIASQSGSSAGVSFSIPANLVRRVAKQLLANGAVTHGYLGLDLKPFEPADALSLGLDRGRGARINQVVPGSPAAAAGLRPNDVILQVETVAIRNDNHLINLISMMPVGQRVRLVVWRERKEIAVEAVVGDWNAVKNRIRPTSAP